MRLVLGLSLDQATNLALIAATGCIVAAVAMFWVMKTIVQKLLVAVLLVLLAFATWSQRESLQECATKVEASLLDANTVQVTTDTTDTTDTTCTFFGVDVNVA